MGLCCLGCLDWLFGLVGMSWIGLFGLGWLFGLVGLVGLVGLGWVGLVGLGFFAVIIFTISLVLQQQDVGVGKGTDLASAQVLCLQHAPISLLRPTAIGHS